MPIYVPPASVTTNIIQWKIVDTNGIEHDLTWNNNQSIFVPKGTKGLGMPGVDLVLEKRPFDPGSKLRYIRTNHTEINLPLVINKSNIMQTMIAAEEIRSWFYTGDERSNSPAYLRVTRPQDNVTRQIAVYYNGGLEGDLAEGTSTFVPYVIRLLAPDPTWTDVNLTEYLYGNSDLNSVFIVNNLGHYFAYPIWTFGGPATNIAITNLTLGKLIQLTNNSGIVLDSGDYITIDTRPPSERDRLPITNSAGNSLYSKLTTASDLETWLQPGVNQIVLTASGTNSSTTVALAFLQRYRGVLR